MTEYYLERYELAEKQVAFAKVGYEQEVKRLGELIAKSKTIEEVKKYSKELEKATKAITELEEVMDYNLKTYRESEGGKVNA